MRTTRALRGQGIFCAATITLCLACCLVRAESVVPQPVRGAHAVMTLSDKTLPPLHLKSHTVDVNIQGRTARVVAESVYRNDTSRDLEATYVFPLPEGAVIERFTMWMNGEPVEGKVAEKERAKATYERIVNKRKDPGLVEQIGENTFRYRIFPVQANADQRIRIEYSQILPVSADSNSINFTYPLYNPSPRLNTTNIAKSFLVSMTLEMESPISKIESSTHLISQRILPDNGCKATVSIEQAHTALDRDFELSIALNQRALPVTSLAYRPATAQGQPAEEGTLMLFVTPQLPEGEELPGKDVVMVMDTSGSMQGVKIKQAIAALRECLSRLRPVDRFAIITFSDYARKMSNDWIEVNKTTQRRGLDFIDGIDAAGGTNIGEAIQQAMEYPAARGRVKQILFATDGCPTVGLTDVGNLVKSAIPNAEAGAKYFTFGIGSDVNTKLLDQIAAQSRGERAYVMEQERIDVKVAQLCDKITVPVLTDVKVEFSEALGVEQVYPPRIGDLYLGRQLAIAAKYKTPGTGNVVLKGKRNGKDVVIEAALTLPESTLQATSHLPKQWAMRKVGFLLDQMRLNGENAELKDEVVRLGTKFGIVTPYTSYLALEPADRVRFDAETARYQKWESKSQSAFGNPDAHEFHSVRGDDTAGGGGVGGTSIDDLIGVGGGTPGTGGGWGGGNGTGTGVDNGGGVGSFGARNGGGRRLMVKRHGGSKATESAADSALRWLAYHQEADGHWDSVKYGTSEKLDVSMTSLALLTFLGAGHTEKVGEYKESVKRAVAWLKSKQGTDGRVFDSTDSVKIPFELGCPEALATYALSEAAGMANVPDTKASAQKAVDYCTEIHQNGAGDDRGGWGFKAKSEANLPATAWLILAMKSAKVAGLRVPHESLDGAIKFLDSVERKGANNLSTYVFSQKEDRADQVILLTAMGMLSRYILGWKREDLQPTIDNLVTIAGTPVWNDKSDPVLWYFSTLCAFQNGGDLWKKWNDPLKAALTENNKKEGDEAGSWLVKNESGTRLGRIGQTVFACSCLQVYYRYARLQPDGDSGTVPSSAIIRTPASDVGKEAVDYSEYLRKLQEGTAP